VKIYSLYKIIQNALNIFNDCKIIVTAGATRSIHTLFSSKITSTSSLFSINIKDWMLSWSGDDKVVRIVQGQ